MGDSGGVIVVGSSEDGDLRSGKRRRKVAGGDSFATLYSSRWSPPLVPFEDGTESGESVCASRLWDNTDRLVE